MSAYSLVELREVLTNSLLAATTTMSHDFVYKREQMSLLFTILSSKTNRLDFFFPLLFDRLSRGKSYERDTLMEWSIVIDCGFYYLMFMVGNYNGWMIEFV